MLQASNVYTITLQVTLDLFQGVTFVSPTNFDVILVDPCFQTVLTIVDPSPLTDQTYVLRDP